MSRFLLIADDNYSMHETHEWAVLRAREHHATDAAIIDTETGTATQVLGDPDLHPFLDRALTLTQHRFLVFLDPGNRPAFDSAYSTLDEAKAYLGDQLDHHSAYAGHVFDVLDCTIVWSDEDHDAQ